MSTSTQPEGAEASSSENTSGQSHNETEMTVDEYQIVAVAPVEFFTPERLNNFINKYNNKEKARVETLENYIKELTNFDYKIFVEQIDMNDLERELIDKESYNSGMANQNKTIEEVIDINEIIKLIKRGMDKKNHFKDILGNEFVDKIKDYINEFFSDKETKQNFYLNDINKIAKKNKEKLHNLMDYNINYSLWTKLKRKNSEDYFWCELEKQLRAIIPRNDKVAIAQIQLLIAEAKANVDNKEPIDEIFGNKFRMSRRSQDLPDVRSVLRKAERKLHEHVEYDIDNNFWDKLDLNLRNVAPDDDKIIAKIKELVDKAKDNVENNKPVDEIFGNKFRLLRRSQDLPDVRSVLRDAETKLREKTKYRVDSSFSAELEQNLRNVTPNDDDEIAANIKELTAKAKNNKATDKSVNELFENIKQMLREQDLPDVCSVLDNAETKLHEHVEYDVDDNFWDKLEKDLGSVILNNDDEIIAKIKELVTEAKGNVDAEKQIDEIFENMKERLQDLPGVQTVLDGVEKKLSEQTENFNEKYFLCDLKLQLKASIPRCDKVANAKIDLVIAETEANLDLKEPIGKIFRNISRRLRVLFNVRTVLRDAERKLCEQVRYDVDDDFWNDLEQDLGNVTLNDDNKIGAKIKEVVDEAKNNIDAQKPIDEIFGNKFRLSRRTRDLPDVHTVLRNAETKLHEKPKYHIESNFWTELKQKLENVTPNEDEKIAAKIKELIAEAKNNVAEEKPVDEIFGKRYRMSRTARSLPDVHTVLRGAERRLREHAKYNVKEDFWIKLEQDLGNFTLNDNEKIATKIKEVIDEAKSNLAAKNPINEIFWNLDRKLRNLPNVYTVLRNFKERISITYYKDKSKCNEFINSLEEDINGLNVRLSSDYKSIFEICSNVSKKLEKFNNRLTYFEDTLRTILDSEQSVIKEEDVQEINRDISIENNIDKIEIMFEHYQNDGTNDGSPSKDPNEAEKVYAKLNQLYNFSAFNDNENSDASDKNTKDYFLDKLPKYLLIEEILKNSESEFDARHVKSVDILVAIPRNHSNEKISTEIVLLLVIDINFEEDRELEPEDFEIGKMLLDSFNVKTIFDLFYNRFHIKNELSEFNKLLSKQPIMRDSSILHTISCPNFEFASDNSALKLSQAQLNLIERIIPGFSIARLNQDNSELKYISRKNLESSETNKISSTLISYLNQSLAIENQNNSSEENYRNHMIGLQIISQSFLQRLSQYNDALRSIAIEENRNNLFNSKDDSNIFNNQLHYTYTISDEVINLSSRHSDIAVLRDLLASATIINKTEIFKERRETFFSIKENYENWQRDSIVQLSLVGLAVMTIVFSILELSNKDDFAKLLVALSIISLLAVILMWKFSVFKKIKHIYTNIKYIYTKIKLKIFSKKKEAIF